MATLLVCNGIAVYFWSVSLKDPKQSCCRQSVQQIWKWCSKSAQFRAPFALWYWRFPWRPAMFSRAAEQIQPAPGQDGCVGVLEPVRQVPWRPEERTHVLKHFQPPNASFIPGLWSTLTKRNQSRQLCFPRPWRVQHKASEQPLCSLFHVISDALNVEGSVLNQVRHPAFWPSVYETVELGNEVCHSCMRQFDIHVGRHQKLRTLVLNEAQ